MVYKEHNTQSVWFANVLFDIIIKVLLTWFQSSSCSLSFFFFWFGSCSCIFISVWFFFSNAFHLCFFVALFLASMHFATRCSSFLSKDWWLTVFHFCFCHQCVWSIDADVAAQHQLSIIVLLAATHIHTTVHGRDAWFDAHLLLSFFCSFSNFFGRAIISFQISKTVEMFQVKSSTCERFLWYFFLFFHSQNRDQKKAKHTFRKKKLNSLTVYAQMLNCTCSRQNFFFSNTNGTCSVCVRLCLFCVQFFFVPFHWWWFCFLYRQFFTNVV